MFRVNGRRDRTPLTGPAAWIIRFAGLSGIICPLGFGAFTVPSVLSVAGGSGLVYVWGTQYGDHVGGEPYGLAPLELTATRATVLLLMVAFLTACLVQLAGGILLILLRPSGFAVLLAGMLLSAVFWWGFDLPLAWLDAAGLLPVLALAWLVYRKASRDLDGLSGPPPTPRYQAILAAAPRRATDLGHDHVGTEHLLLALLDDTHASATQVLERFAPATEITSALQKDMASEPYNAS